MKAEQTTSQKLESLRAELDAVYSKMPQTFEQMKNRDRAAFIICRDIEKLENPQAYKQNKNHWDGHQLSF